MKEKDMESLEYTKYRCRYRYPHYTTFTNSFPSFVAPGACVIFACCGTDFESRL